MLVTPLCLRDTEHQVPFLVLTYYKGKGDVLDKTNYRPLSVVAHISKVLEKIIQVQVMDYLESHAFLTNDQPAYLK